MHYALLLLALHSADCDCSDFSQSAEKIAPPCAHPQQVVEAHFQLGSGAGSESQPHGNEYNEPAISLGHPHSSSVSREYRNTEVTARNLQDIQLKSISGIFNKIMSTLTSVGIPPFYVALWPIGVMLIFVYIHMLPGAGAAAAVTGGTFGAVTDIPFGSAVAESPPSAGAAFTVSPSSCWEASDIDENGKKEENRGQPNSRFHRKNKN